ncbi:MAG: beta-lactamase family protein, partial [Clostridia bacterium]|nr:beta-lactamase family protein [Clostridia bacterium]
MSGERQPIWPAYEEYGRKLLEPYGTPGASVAIAEDGRMTYHHGFGYRDAEERLPITPDTVFGIGSITKSFTAMCIMKLQEAGKLSVYDPVVRYLPEFRTPDPELTRQMTIHHFLTHTSGLPPLPSLMRALARSMREDPDVDQPEARKRIEEAEPVDTYEQLLECIANTPFELLGPPGEFFSYSNDAYALLGAIVARVSGQSFTEYLRKEILEPAGMTSTTMDVPEGPAFPDVSSLYIEKEKDGKEWIKKSPVWWQAPAMDAAGFLRSSARDMLRYLEIFRTGGRVGDRRILSEESVREMTAPRVQVSPTMYYGYGLMITPDYHGVTLVEHGGNVKGVSAYMSVVPERGWTGVA